MPCVILHWIERPSWVLSYSSNISVYDLLIDYHSELYGFVFYDFSVGKRLFLIFVEQNCVKISEDNIWQ